MHTHYELCPTIKIRNRRLRAFRLVSFRSSHLMCHNSCFHSSNLSAKPLFDTNFKWESIGWHYNLLEIVRYAFSMTANLSPRLSQVLHGRNLCPILHVWLKTKMQPLGEPQPFHGRSSQNVQNRTVYDFCFGRIIKYDFCAFLNLWNVLYIRYEKKTLLNLSYFRWKFGSESTI